MKHTSKKKGMKFEGKIQKAINSGATWFSPLDLQDGKNCIECKYTDKKGFRVSLDLLEYVWNKSLDLNKEPNLTIGIKRNDNQVFVLNCQIRLQNK